MMDKKPPPKANFGGAFIFCNLIPVFKSASTKKEQEIRGLPAQPKPGNKLGIAGIVKSFAIQPVN
jgi:hypothetical protein